MQYSNAMAQYQGLTDRAAEYSKALALVQQKVVQIISGITTKVLLERGGPSIGWTDGANIHLDFDKTNTRFAKALESQDRGHIKKAIASISAVAKHELAHLMFTPRWEHPIFTELNTRKGGARRYHYAMNLLEDQRIETLFIKKFPIASGYFTVMISEWVLGAKTDVVNNAWPFVAGRWYLPVDIRNMCKQLFAVEHGDAVTERIAEITAEYRHIDLVGTTDPAEITRIANLIVEFHGYLQSTPQDPGPVGDDTNQDGIEKGEPQDASDEAEQAAGDDDGNGGGQGTGQDEQDGAEDGAGLTDEGGFGDDAGSAPSDQDGDDGADGADDGPQGDGSGSGESGGQQGESSDGQGAGGAGGGKQNPKAPTPRQVKAAAREMIEEELDNSQTGNEIDAITDAVDSIVADGNSGFSNTPQAEIKIEIDPTPAAHVQRAAIAAALRNLRNDLSPQWERHQNRGSRIDMRTVLHNRAKQMPTVDIFRRNMMHGDESVHMDVMLMIDISGSMVYSIRETMLTAWAIKKALSDCDIRTGIAAYDCDVYMVSEPGDEFDRVRVPQTVGGTEPSAALRAVGQHFAKAKAKQPVLIILTDGEWAKGFNPGPSAAEQEIEALHRQGVTTVLAGLMQAVSRHGSHGCKLAADLDSPRAMAQLTEQVVATLMAQQRH